MKAAVWTSDRAIVIENRDEPEPAPGRVVVEVRAVGICGTDLHFLRGEFPPPAGLTPGHEIAGVVLSGEGFVRGTPVAVDPMLSCLNCAECRNGQSSICRNAKLIGVSVHGGMQQRFEVPAANVYPLPAGVDPSVAPLAEPIAVCIRGIHRAELPLGARVLVLGAGTIGLVAAMLLRDSTAEVAITGRYPHQRELAMKLGASAAFEPESADLKAWSRARRPDCIIETVGGGGETLQEAFRYIRPGGTICALGVFTGNAQIQGFRLVNDEIRLIGSVMYGRAGSNSEYGVGVNMLGRYRSDLPRFQTHTLPLARAMEAFETANDKSKLTIKVTVLPQE